MYFRVPTKYRTSWSTPSSSILSSIRTRPHPHDIAVLELLLLLLDGANDRKRLEGLCELLEH